MSRLPARPVAVAVVLVALAGRARAECPRMPDDPVCRPWAASLLPTVYGALYAPLDGGAFVGGGLEAILLAWSDNSPAFGPSQGRIRFDFSVLGGTGMAAGTMLMYRAGAQVSFERNASRAYAIPYFAMDFGALWTEATRRRWFVDGGVGLYLIHRRAVIVDAEVTALIPFKDAGELGGVSARLAVSFALW